MSTERSANHSPRRQRRKPPSRVMTINGEDPKRDVVTDADYAAAIAAQDAVLFAEGHERKVLGRIRSRLTLGARDAGEKYYFDEARGIVRRREKEDAG